ncbi:unannotated protein [freshwater metagenome]|uniref:Unannotated protein n=1 Tax=freshwater metagenome TaxID=449393 RepID=A0A6J7XRC0_9ZZZZ|nr:hypothetical protein [Actinomycetota bacterium]
MLLLKVRELASFLSEVDREPGEIARYLAFKTLVDFQPSTIFIKSVKDNHLIENIGGYGFDPKTLSDSRSFYITSNSPSADAIRNNQVIVINGPSDMEATYPDMGNWSLILSQWKSGYFLPINGVGCISFYCENESLESEEIKMFLLTVSEIVGFALSHQRQLAKSKPRQSVDGSVDSDSPLSRRQEIILKHLVGGLTNSEIALELGFSESLVRQETVILYAHFEVSGRRDLIDSPPEGFNY